MWLRGRWGCLEAVEEGVRNEMESLGEKDRVTGILKGLLCLLIRNV